jgi:hypothetical protein
MQAGGLTRYLRSKTDVLLISGVAVVYLTGYVFYTRDADYSLPAYEACITETPSVSPISTKFSELDAVHQASDALLATIAALPNLDASGGLPDLHTTLRHYKEAGLDDLFDTIQHLSQRRFADLFRADDAVRNEVRDLLFLWAGVENADPASRGPFIDARELEYMEKAKDEPFLQDGRYPNPAPLDAGKMREEFNIAWNRAYARLLTQIAAKDLFDAPPPANSDAALSASGLEKLARHAADFPTAEQKVAYWTNVVRVLQPPGASFARSANGVAIDKAIRASIPALSLQSVLERLGRSPVQKDGHYTDRAGRPIGFNVSYLPQKVRLVCYGHIQEEAAAMAARTR